MTNDLTLTIGTHNFTYSEEGRKEFEVACEIFRKYPTACEKCAQMMDKFSAKVKRYFDRKREFELYEAEIDMQEKAEKSYIHWENMLNEALNGKPSEFFKKMNNLTSGN